MDKAMKKSSAGYPYQVRYTEYIDYADKIGIEKKVLGQSVQMHWHEFCELELVFGGEGVQWKHNQPMPFGRGVLSLQLPTDFHEVIVNSRNPPELYSVKFAERFIAPEIFQAVFIGKRNRQIMLPDETFETVKQDFDQLYEEFRGSRLFKEQMMRNILEKIIVCYYRNLEESSDMAEGDMEPHEQGDIFSSYHILFDCLNYIQNHYESNITLQEMADRVNMSPNYFSTFFKQNTGCTLRDYLKNIRIRHALSILASSDASVGRVAEMVGMPSYEHFSRLFTKEVGVSPSGFRKQIREKE